MNMPSSTYYAVLLALVLGVGCGGGKEKATPKAEAKVDATPKTAPKAEPKVEVKKTKSPTVAPSKLITDPIVEREIRITYKKPTGELTKADLAKVTDVLLNGTQITDAGLKEVAKLQKLTKLNLTYTRNITDEGLYGTLI